MKKIRLAVSLYALCMAFAAPSFATLDRLYNPQATARITAGTASSSITFTDAASIDADSVLICNEGTQTVYWAMGVGNATAVVPSSTPSLKATPILPGAIESFFKGQGTSTIAVITPTGTSLVDITAGSGL